MSQKYIFTHVTVLSFAVSGAQFCCGRTLFCSCSVIIVTLLFRSLVYGNYWRTASLRSFAGPVLILGAGRIVGADQNTV